MRLVVAIIVIGACIFLFGALFHAPAAVRTNLGNAQAPAGNVA